MHWFLATNTASVCVCVCVDANRAHGGGGSPTVIVRLMTTAVTFTEDVQASASRLLVAASTNQSAAGNRVWTQQQEFAQQINCYSGSNCGCVPVQSLRPLKCASSVSEGCSQKEAALLKDAPSSSSSPFSYAAAASVQSPFVTHCYFDFNLYLV